MAKQAQSSSSKAQRGGDTSRSSSQGRKASSGGSATRRGNPQIDEATKAPTAGAKKARK
ncbi:MAG: hypothetical protein H7Y42_13445 [Chitinophagaceae bacterium]|nr:hypothetical protein [Chitinophagaceae bacterium]